MGIRADVRAIIFGLVLGVAVVSAGVAIAGDQDVVSDEPLEINPVTGEKMEAVIDPSTGEPLDIANLTPAKDDQFVESAQDDGAANHIPTNPDPSEKVSECREMLAGPVGPEQRICEVVVAKAAGDLRPGDYSNQELESALESAGVLGQ